MNLLTNYSMLLYLASETSEELIPTLFLTAVATTTWALRTADLPEIDYDKIDKGSRNGHLFRNHRKQRRRIQELLCLMGAPFAK